MDICSYINFTIDDISEINSVLKTPIAVIIVATIVTTAIQLRLGEAK